MIAKTRSLMKYPGSKQLMMSKLLKHVPQSGDILVDVFTGSTSVALNTNYKHYLLNDRNEDLITLYKLIQADAIAVIKETKKMFRPDTNNQNYYYGVRDAFNTMTNLEERAILLLYLSRHAFNGLIRYNSMNNFNTPHGKYKTPYHPEREILFFAEKLESAEFHCLDFSAFIKLASNKINTKLDKFTTCYCDPPYLKHDTQTSVFTQYTSEGFNINRHIELDAVLTDNSHHFSQVLVSNHDGKLLKETYKGAKRIIKFRVTRTISSKTKERRPAPEVLLYY